MVTSSTNEFVQSVLIEAPVGRVWQAVSDSAEFGSWFGMACGGAFVPGAEIPCEITVPEEHRGTKFAIWIEAVEPERLFSFRWHPYAVDGYANAPTTLVTFTIEPHGDGTKVTIVESGFDDIPLERRAEAFSSNEEGWRIQSEQLSAYVVNHA